MQLQKCFNGLWRLSQSSSLTFCVCTGECCVVWIVCVFCKVTLLIRSYSRDSYCNVQLATCLVLSFLLPFSSSPSLPLLLLPSPPPFPSSHQMERTPLITRTFHARAASMICLLVFCDAFLMGQSLAHMWAIGPSVQMVFALEVSPDTGHVE